MKVGEERQYLQGGTSVDNGVGGAENFGPGDGDGVDVDFPVSLLGNGDPGEVTGVLGGIGSTEVKLRARGGKVEGEDRVRDLAFGNESLEDWVGIIVRDGLEAHSQKTICLIC